MALNIPVNLMSTAIPPVQPTSAANSNSEISIAAIQPATTGADARGAATDGGGMNNSNAEQKALMFKQRTTQGAASTPDKAEPKSVVTAQTTPTSLTPAASAPTQSVEKTKTPQAQNARPQSELDPYAPPNPLPTAPILELAASYAKLTVKPD